MCYGVNHQYYRMIYTDPSINQNYFVSVGFMGCNTVWTYRSHVNTRWTVGLLVVTLCRLVGRVLTPHGLVGIYLQVNNPEDQQ
jgi:hypothetical protein